VNVWGLYEQGGCEDVKYEKCVNVGANKVAGFVTALRFDFLLAAIGRNYLMHTLEQN
jgi:hypothetical protein